MIQNFSRELRLQNRAVTKISGFFGVESKIGKMNIPGASKKAWEDHSNLKKFDEYKKPSKYISPEQKEQIKAIKTKLLYEQDFKEKLLDAKTIVEEPKKIIDELFGDKKPQPYVLRKVNLKEIYATPRGRHYDFKMKNYFAFAPEFNTFETFNDPKIEEKFNAIKELFEKTTGKAKDFDPFFQDENLSIREVLLSDQKFEALFSDLKTQVESIHYQLIPTFCSKLAQQAYCVEDPFQIWDKIEERISDSLHLFEPLQIAKIIYSATVRAPKRLSLKIRTQLINLMLEDVEKLSTGDKAIVLASLTNSMSISRNRVFNKDLKQNFKSILASSSNGPSDVLNLLAASVQSKLKDSLRTTRGSDASYKLELSFYFDKYLDYLVENYSVFSKEEKLRFFQMIKYSRIQNAFEVYDFIEEFVLENSNSKTLSDMELLTLVELLDTVNGPKSVGSQDLWSVILGEFKKRGLSNFKDSEIAMLFSAVAKSGFFDKKQDEVLVKKILEIASKDADVDVASLGLIARGIMHSKYDSKELILATIKSASFSQKAFPLKNYPYLKALRYIAGVKYPGLNYDHFDTRCYHPEQIMNPMKLVDDIHREKVAEIYNTLVSKELDLFMLIQWENLQVVDISFPVHRVGILVDTISSPYNDGQNINKDLQMIEWCMRENGWRLILINYEEFKQHGTDYIENIREQITKAYSKSIEEKGTIDEILRQRNLMRLEEMADVIFSSSMKEYDPELFVRQGQQNNFIQKFPYKIEKNCYSMEHPKPQDDEEQVGFIDSNSKVPEKFLNQDPESHGTNLTCPQSAFKCLRSKTVLTKEERIDFYNLKKLIEPKYDPLNPKHVKRLNHLVTMHFGDKSKEIIDGGYSSDQWEKLGFQGKDPRTDFRGSGYAGLDIFIRYLEANEEPSQAQSKLTQEGKWLFACNSISITF